MRCINSVSYSFSLNGEICGDIRPSKGLRQGDPLSPYLFLICAEGFSSLIHLAQLRGAIEGFKCSKCRPEISHLFFTDDSLLFTKANVANCTAMRKVLDIYVKASGQVVNFSKSALCVSPSISIAEAERLATTVGIKLVDCHDRYLGLPCFTGRSKRKLFSDIVDRVWRKIKGWGGNFLSVDGKEILIKAVIQSIPTYAMSLFRLPKCIAEIHRLCARFWWGRNDKSRKIHWCTWDHLSKTKSEEGSRVSRFRDF
ncbi:hypothetical protein Ddye_002958 [Dipteronia dyeriana]|uniref:Reverse transcriptase domain-containing protein n=1 Tax=Dipteronia dyeriana TaxID=168575 RepID=A0AAD9XRE0_9ROSI|nr:hypothetical protein Ddye_002958 [Dipteronia dyeriana]